MFPYFWNWLNGKGQGFQSYYSLKQKTFQKTVTTQLRQKYQLPAESEFIGSTQDF